MSRHPPSLPMSQIIASDAPLLSPMSPSDAQWDHQQSPYSPTHHGAFAFNYYALPPSPPNSVGSNSTDSPIPTSRMLKMRMTPESSSDGDQQLCLPTHQLFDFPETLDAPSPLSPSESSSEPPSSSVSINTGTAPAKRACTPAASVTKKPRASGERINSKDFIPPDVSGLSKREARLVKNRAAAFLSRQRKREEFETMEVRVNELEQENARLQALSQSGSGYEDLLSEIEQLRSRLSDAEERERELSAELAQKSVQAVPVKVEHYEQSVPPTSSARSVPMSSPHKSGASLGLMVLLCALPTLLSMPMHTTLPTTFSFPLSGSSTVPVSSSAFDYNAVIPNEYDWSLHPNGAGFMDLDIDDNGRLTTGNPSSTPAPRKLEFADIDSEALSALGGLDISFDASPTDSGKIRVRIHSSTSDPTPTTSQLPHASSTDERSPTSSSSLAMWAGPESDSTFGSSFSSSYYANPVSPVQAHPPPPSATTTSGEYDQLGPFLGVGTSHSDYDLGMNYGSDASSMASPMAMYQSGDPTGYGNTQAPDSIFGYMQEARNEGASSPIGKRRVRIALKSMPTAGGEGGEWEVQVC
ncbi:hypothetical protein SERLA73DRAFT_159500 [Serpula lacrymans var. lacrymans S7.3]|uniref:BZIP domain-containing protein n=2 Tax=Serpula lacrymans var. lacrymans TaxID=341189 RepID=F8PSZ3_SERL3|nr:uncharacterized protein SERLADRAFT_436285 [Serpula lacrymans var. lacrymans S7.9]EGO00851.1 hypothetical protein SERLA73DRAFT_159500 [Serpula lacrymans var. lacrymans S7.3]EGO26474.1 hypothetical protein SERLADRAFT_436285 [Serpula lacrymans var. lacrymans S7.9]